MVTDLIKKVLATNNGCPNYFDTYSEWFRNKIEKCSDDYDTIVKAVANPDSYIDTADAEAISIFLDGNVVSLNDVIKNLKQNDFQYIVNGVDLTDSLTNSVKSELQSNTLYQTACTILSNVNDEQRMASDFLMRTSSLDFCATSAALRDYIAKILGDERLVAKTKLLTLIGDLNMSASSDDGVTDIFESTVYEYTGTHPAVLWAIKTFDLDYATLIQNVANQLIAGFYAIGQLALNALGAITKAVRWVKGAWNTYVVAGGSVFDKVEPSTNHYDNTCEQLFMQFRYPNTDLGIHSLGQSLGFTDTEIRRVIDLCESRPLVKFDTPFAAIYLGHYNGVFGDTILVRIYPKPIVDAYNNIGYNAYNFGNITTLDNLVESWNGFNGDTAFNQTYASGQNVAFASGFAFYAKEMINVWGALLYSQFKETGESISDIFNHRAEGRAPRLENSSTATNANIFKYTHELYYNGDFIEGSLAYMDGTYVLNVGDVNEAAKSMMRGVITYANLAYDDDTFAPYTTENGFYPSCWTLKTDNALAQGYGNILKTITYAAIAVAVIYGTVKITKSIKLAYESAQSSYWQAINNGNAADAAKYAKKSRFLSKLTGATSSSGSTVTSSLLNNNDASTIIKLISGQ